MASKVTSLNLEEPMKVFNMIACPKICQQVAKRETSEGGTYIWKSGMDYG